jgi:multicomponent Na+:H+ antiporter subunit C
MESLLAQFMTKYNYWAIIGLIMIGLYAMIAKRNLVKKIIGMNIVQTAVILFFVSIGAKHGKTIPIIAYEHGDKGHHAVRAIDYINPLPHVLMLTAIVVSVATLGVALALAVKVHRQYGTLDEDEIAERIKAS